MAAHSKLFSPSKAAGWFACSGRPVMEAQAGPDEPDDDSYNGSARHLVCAAAIQDGKDVVDYIGREIVFWRVEDQEGECFREDLEAPNGETASVLVLHTVEYKDDWEEEDQDYVSLARQLAEASEEWGVELKVDFSTYTKHDDPEDSFGLLDFYAVRKLTDAGYELVVMDRKSGRVHVNVERNKQLLLYALGRYVEVELLYQITRVRLIVFQREAQEWDCSIEELLAFGENDVPAAAARVVASTETAAFDGLTPQWYQMYLNPEPTVEACAYCRAMATCPSMQAAVQRGMEVDFDFVDTVADVSEFPTVDSAKAYKLVPMIEEWCKAVKADLRRRLNERQEGTGWKLVVARQGNRKWVDPKKVEAYFKKTVRLNTETMYQLKLISPTQAEKLVKEKAIGPGQWKTLQADIDRADPAISMVPETDKRQAYVPRDPTDDFPTLPDETGAST
jgi:hypothetical protein